MRSVVERNVVMRSATTRQWSITLGHRVVDDRVIKITGLMEQIGLGFVRRINMVTEFT